MGNNVTGVLALRSPWPSVARTVWRDHKRYLETYMQAGSASIDSDVMLYSRLPSPTLASTSRATVPLVMRMGISGSRAVWTVCAFAPWADLPCSFLLFVQM